MIIVSLHLGNRWKDIQKEYIKRYTNCDYTYLVYDVPKSMPHIRSLALIPRIVDERSKPKPKELIVLFDSDCFPISKDWVDNVHKNLKGNEFTAVQRLENPHSYRCIAHPCFCAWYYGTKITFSQIASNPYVDGYEKRKWYPIHRTNKFNYHRQLFAVYGNIVYHHGAGSRNVNNQPFFYDGLYFYDYIFKFGYDFICSITGEISPYQIDKNINSRKIPRKNPNIRKIGI